MTNFTLFVPTDQYRQYYTELCNHAKNSACECSTQSGKIPELLIPRPDAGSSAAPTRRPAPPSEDAAGFTVPTPITQSGALGEVTAGAGSMMIDSPQTEPEDELKAMHF